MDGIPSGLSAITPILPETAIISEKASMSGPQVEIMPLPTDSFNGDGATAEFLNNPYTLDHDGRGQGAGGRPAAAPSGNGAEGDATGARLGEAYTLSLGYGEEKPMPPEIAQELTRAQNYEKLGRAASRLAPRRDGAPGAAELGDTRQQAGQTPSIAGERLRAMAQAAAGQSLAAEIPEAVQGRADAGLTGGVQPTGGQTSGSSGFNPMAVQLTPSDLEAILTLEPDLQEALLRLLGGDEVTVTQGQTGPADPPVSGRGPAIPGGNIPDAAAGALLQETTAELLTSETLSNAEAMLKAAMPQRQSGDVPAPSGLTVTARDIQAADGEAQLAAALTTAAAARGGNDTGMINLRKITELPYALYLFGSTGINKRPQAEEDELPVRAEQTRPQKGHAQDFLKLSEAVKMASVLHSIYHGGSGYFQPETPWHAPYVRYAVKNGIVRSGEFDNLNEFATRAEMAYIFSGCVPKAEFPVINYTPRLSDVDEDTGYGAHIYLLSRAGVLTVGDKSGRFYPESMIPRTEAAAIIGRIATPGDRKRF